MRTLKVTLQLVGEKHLVVAGAGAEHVCPVGDAAEIGTAILAVLEAAKSSVEAEPESGNGNHGSNGSNGSSRAPGQVDSDNPSLFEAFANIAGSEEARSIFGALLDVGEKFSVKDPPKAE